MWARPAGLASPMTGPGNSGDPPARWLRDLDTGLGAQSAPPHGCRTWEPLPWPKLRFLFLLLQSQTVDLRLFDCPGFHVHAPVV